MVAAAIPSESMRANHYSVPLVAPLVRGRHETAKRSAIAAISSVALVLAVVALVPHSLAPASVAIEMSVENLSEAGAGACFLPIIIAVCHNLSALCFCCSSRNLPLAVGFAVVVSFCVAAIDGRSMRRYQNC